MPSSKKPAKTMNPRENLENGYQINRDWFFTFWIQADNEGQDLDWMCERIAAKCKTYKGNDSRDRTISKATVRQKMNYYKKRAAASGGDLEFPPVIRDNQKSLEQITREYRETRKAALKK
jgi:triphosphoribosyl-dephospho-CoA synthetase